jgi:hypothetical protein
VPDVRFQRRRQNAQQAPQEQSEKVQKERAQELPPRAQEAQQQAI